MSACGVSGTSAGSMFPLINCLIQHPGPGLPKTAHFDPHQNPGSAPSPPHMLHRRGGSIDRFNAVIDRTTMLGFPSFALHRACLRGAESTLFSPSAAQSPHVRDGSEVSSHSVGSQPWLPAPARLHPSLHRCSGLRNPSETRGCRYSWFFFLVSPPGGGLAFFFLLRLRGKEAVWRIYTSYHVGAIPLV